MAVSEESGRIHRPLSGDDIAQLHDEFLRIDTVGNGLIDVAEFKRRWFGA